MTTSKSPTAALKKQARTIAGMMKKAERGDLPDPTGKVAAALARETFKTGVVMDDKVITIEMPWTTIRETNVEGLAEFILKQMQGDSDAAH